MRFDLLDTFDLDNSDFEYFNFHTGLGSLLEAAAAELAPRYKSGIAYFALHGYHQGWRGRAGAGVLFCSRYMEETRGADFGGFDGFRVGFTEEGALYLHALDHDGGFYGELYALTYREIETAEEARGFPFYDVGDVKAGMRGVLDNKAPIRFGRRAAAAVASSVVWFDL